MVLVIENWCSCEIKERGTTYLGLETADEFCGSVTLAFI